MTPYQEHEKRGHRMTRWSPNGVDVIEECAECGARFLHNPAIGYPITLDSRAPANQCVGPVYDRITAF